VTTLHDLQRSGLAVAGRLSAFFACMYHAALRPGEVTALRKSDGHLPEKGWGLITLAKNRPEANIRWTNSHDAHEERGLKHRAATDVRLIPVPPVLVRILLAHIKGHPAKNTRSTPARRTRSRKDPRGGATRPGSEHSFPSGSRRTCSTRSAAPPTRTTDPCPHGSAAPPNTNYGTPPDSPGKARMTMTPQERRARAQKAGAAGSFSLSFGAPVMSSS